MRRLPVILIVPAILLALTGCSGSDEPDATTDTDTAISDTAADTSGELAGESSGQSDDASDSAGVFVSLVGSCETGTCDYRLSNAEGGTDVFEALAGRKSVRFEVDPEVVATTRSTCGISTARALVARRSSPGVALMIGSSA